uniref:DUF1540 domain-containing protein n=1 Tax=Ascaris lumbricoides TaxID=6252 RepID=A0A0M3IGR3_ASCLU
MTSLVAGALDYCKRIRCHYNEKHCHTIWQLQIMAAGSSVYVLDESTNPCAKGRLRRKQNCGAEVTLAGYPS